MTVKINSLWNTPGCTILITEDLESEYLPQGFYTFVGKDEYGILLYKSSRHYILEEWDEDSEVQVSFTEPEMRLESLIIATTSQIIHLIEDGWELDGDSILDMNPYYEKLIAYIKLKEVLNSSGCLE